MSAWQYIREAAPYVFGYLGNQRAADQADDAVGAANNAIAESTAMQLAYLDESRAMGRSATAPYQQAGYTALAGMMDMMGLPRFASNFAYQPDQPSGGNGPPGGGARSGNEGYNPGGAGPGAGGAIGTVDTSYRPGITPMAGNTPQGSSMFDPFAGTPYDPANSWSDSGFQWGDEIGGVIGTAIGMPWDVGANLGGLLNTQGSSGSMGNLSGNTLPGAPTPSIGVDGGLGGFAGAGSIMPNIGIGGVNNFGGINSGLQNFGAPTPGIGEGLGNFANYNSLFAAPATPASTGSGGLIGWLKSVFGGSTNAEGGHFPRLPGLHSVAEIEPETVEFDDGRVVRYEQPSILPPGTSGTVIPGPKGAAMAMAKGKSVPGVTPHITGGTFGSGLWNTAFTGLNPTYQPGGPTQPADGYANGMVPSQNPPPFGGVMNTFFGNQGSVNTTLGNTAPGQGNAGGTGTPGNPYTVDTIPNILSEAPMYDWKTDPGYQFRMDEGQRMIERGAAARGGALSGGALKAITSWGQDYASNEYGKIFDRLGMIAGYGGSSSNTSAATQSGYGQAGANAIGGAGATSASAYMAGGAINANSWDNLTRMYGWGMGG